jgi:hypothetical protein
MLYRILDGLPSYGPMAVSFPSDWGKLGREGLVVEFAQTSGERWVGNFRRGLGGLNTAMPHPDEIRVIVFAGGDAWSVDPNLQAAVRFAPAVDECWPVPNGIVLSRQGLAFLRVGPSGIAWHTRRLSFDGFKDVSIKGDQLSALAWSPIEDCWIPCSVNLVTGRSEGGSYAFEDADHWEAIAPDVPG